ncbi:MAG: hypothetical protein OXG68_09200 [Chloroflexi bacterium]|nr:hypothetical protein [Chloroflexota bacterium]
MERIASNLVASLALSTVLLNAAMPPTANPYLEEQSGEGRLPDQLARQIEMAESRLHDDAHVSPEERPLRASNNADYDIFCGGL